jgi:hypothetical protein
MATKKELEAKRELARMYYMQGETQRAISGRVGVSANSVLKWVEEGDWSKKRAAIQVTRPELVNKSLDSLGKILDQALESGDADLMAGLPDKLIKCAAAIEKLDRKANVVSTIESFLDFSNWMGKRMEFDEELTPALVKFITKYQDLYINENLKK